MIRWTYIKLLGITPPNRLALIAELIEKQKSPESILAHEPRQTKERKGSDATEG